MDKNIVKMAFEGNAICYYPELQASGASLTQEHIVAMNMVEQDPTAFCSIIRSELERWPLTKHYLGHLIERRLQQNEILSSNCLPRLFSRCNPIEERLARLHGQVRNLEVISTIGIPEDVDAWEETEEIFLDIWAEIFVMDFISSGRDLKFTNLEKVIRPRDQTQIDLLAQCNNEHYAIEITRIRKRDFSGWTLPGMTETWHQPENIKSLRKVLRTKLRDKNKQLEKFCANEKQTFDKRLVVLKTSQEEYQDGSEIVRDETKALFDRREFPAIDEVLLIYDIENYDWLK